MKNSFRLSLYAFLLGAAMTLISCQDEEPFAEDIDQEQTLTANANEMELMKRIVDNDGSYDNIVDGASCFDIQFPYTVVINQSEIMVEAMADLELIEEALDELDDVDYDMGLIFPVTITLSDYTEVTVANSEDFQSIAEKCVEGGDDDDIECIDVVYPLTIFTYNPNFQLTNTVEVENDFQFRRFFAGLNESDLMSFDFPVSFQHTDSTKITVNSNSELADAIENAKMVCDEDDDDDYNDDDFTEESLNSVLVKCPWVIRRLEKSTVDNSEQYVNYFLTFSEEGRVVASNEFGYSMEGEWSTSVSDYRVVLEVEFDSSSDFNGDWWVYEIADEKIKLFTDDENKIVLEKACDYKPNECSESYVKENLKECSWEILNEDGTFFEELIIEFSSEMHIYVRNPNGTVVDEGNWSISGNVITLSNLKKTLANYIGEWEVITCGEGRFNLKRNDEIIVLVMQCEETS